MTAAWDWNAETRASLGAFLSERGLVGGDVVTTPIGDGHSNLTYLVSDGQHRVIVRRPPPPPVPAGAHDVLREARFMDALWTSDVPVPQVLAVAQAGEIIDVPFYVMSVADGPVVSILTPEPLADPQSRRQIGESLIDCLAELHSVDWRARGMADLGRPEGFNQRHLARMARLVTAEEGSLFAEFAELHDWLAAHVPVESGAAIVHNDYRIGNVVLAPEQPGRVLAVLDWELATLGDPLFDLGYFLASIPESDAGLTPTEALGTAMLEPGYPTRQALAERYAAHTRADLSNLAWYSTLALWKLAALYEYSRRRAEDDYYETAQVTALLDAAQQTAEGRR